MPPKNMNLDRSSTEASCQTACQPGTGPIEISEIFGVNPCNYNEKDTAGCRAATGGEDNRTGTSFLCTSRCLGEAQLEWWGSFVRAGGSRCVFSKRTSLYWTLFLPFLSTQMMWQWSRQSLCQPESDLACYFRAGTYVCCPIWREWDSMLPAMDNTIQHIEDVPRCTTTPTQWMVTENGPVKFALALSQAEVNKGHTMCHR